jgi:hypothetical protein
MFSYSENAVPDQQTKPEPELLSEMVCSLRPMPHNRLFSSAVPHFIGCSSFWKKKISEIFTNTF